MAEYLTRDGYRVLQTNFLAGAYEWLFAACDMPGEQIEVTRDAL
jgi:hypothetical protein